VLVAHNRYSSAQPSGENAVVDAELRMLVDAGVAVVPYLRSSDEIPALPAAQRAALPWSPVRAGRAQRELADLITRERPDVVHLHNPYPLISPWVVRTAHAHGVPVVQTVHNFRHTCVSGVFFRDGRPCHDCAGRAFPAPAVRHACYRGSRAQSAAMATALAVHRRTWHRLDRFLALTPAVADYLRGLGIPADRVVTKPNSAPDPGPPAPLGEGFLFAGRLAPEKGIDLLLDAWTRHPAGSLGPLRVAGDGPLRDRVRAAAAERSDIVALGLLDEPAVRRELRRATVVVVPSTWDEVCPMIAVEALAHGRPVLATTTGGLPWLVGDAGWLVNPDPATLATALPTARADAAAKAPAARARYNTTFHPSVATAALIAVYASLTP
jgi:glycosyltransferase involved in cell wall biosynthesis